MCTPRLVWPLCLWAILIIVTNVVAYRKLNEVTTPIATFNLVRAW